MLIYNTQVMKKKLINNKTALVAIAALILMGSLVMAPVSALAFGDDYDTGGFGGGTYWDSYPIDTYSYGGGGSYWDSYPIDTYSYTPSYSSYTPSYSSYIPASSYSSPRSYSPAPQRGYTPASSPISASYSNAASEASNRTYVSSSNTNNNTNNNTASANNTNNINNEFNPTNVFNPTNNNDARINLVVLGGGTSQTPTQNNLSVICVINPTTAYVNQNLSFSATATGGSGNYTYSWTGSDGITGYGQSFTGMFSYAGTKTATVTVTSGGQTASATCSATVQGNYYQPPVYTPPVYNPPIVSGATVIRNPTVGTPVAGVFLSQVPATGISLGYKMALFAVGLLAWSLFAAYMISRKRKLASVNGFEVVADTSSNDVVARIEAFKKANMAKKGLTA